MIVGRRSIFRINCRLQREGKFPVERLCKVYDYGDFAVALKDMEEGRVVKPVLRWS